MAPIAPRDNGFTLLETVIATALLVAGVLSLAHLFGLAAALDASSRHRSLAAILAAQKLEELRTLSNPAPGADFVDVHGRPLAGGGEPPRGTAFVRRWTVEPSPANPLDCSILQVTVTSAAAGLRRGQVRLVAMKTRRSP